MHHAEHALIIPDEDLGLTPEPDGGGAGWGTRLLWLGIGAVLGAVAAYFADPDRGNARRAELAQRAAARKRDAQEQAIDTGRDVTQRAMGAAIDAVPEVTPVSDAVLLERVRSQALGPAGVDTSKVVTTVRDGGIVEIRGQLDTDTQRRDLLRAVADVDGVREVVDLTHLPHEPAPTRS
ncbi:BON domain-containing protein [Egicoccus sp. AB-alg2]|uniref:BON domain-containing protein n=1 Tax=Egicoccus sp. AB-alg2 TaxID=3242693 RepID=UPI00359D8294